MSVAEILGVAVSLLTLGTVFVKLTTIVNRQTADYTQLRYMVEQCNTRCSNIEARIDALCKRLDEYNTTMGNVQHKVEMNAEKLIAEDEKLTLCVKGLEERILHASKKLQNMIFNVKFQTVDMSNWLSKNTEFTPRQRDREDG